MLRRRWFVALARQAALAFALARVAKRFVEGTECRTCYNSTAMIERWPEYDTNGDLPQGIHQASLVEVLQHFGTTTLQRRIVARRLERIFNLAQTTGQVARFVVFGSFVTAKPEPKDVDIFMLMRGYIRC